jgi:AmiR/NasT family two-component response regulator
MTEEESTARVSQASGMVSVQADCSCAEALELLKQQAASSGESLESVADAVVRRTVRFGSRQTA